MRGLLSQILWHPAAEEIKMEWSPTPTHPQTQSKPPTLSLCTSPQVYHPPSNEYSRNPRAKSTATDLATTAAVLLRVPSIYTLIIRIINIDVHTTPNPGKQPRNRERERKGFTTMVSLGRWLLNPSIAHYIYWYICNLWVWCVETIFFALFLLFGFWVLHFEFVSPVFGLFWSWQLMFLFILSCFLLYLCSFNQINSGICIRWPR